MGRNTHDQFFKNLMSERKFFEYFLKAYTPADLLEKIDFKSLLLYDSTGKRFEKKMRQNFESDVMYLAKYKHQKKKCLFWFHVEHQTRSDPDMSLRIFNYQMAELVNYRKKNPDQPLPSILSFVYYQGKRPWSHSLNFWDLFADSDLARRYLGQPVLIDLPNLPLGVLREHFYIGEAEVLLKHVGQQDCRQHLKLILTGLGHMDDNLRMDSLKYMASEAKFEKPNEFIQAIERYLPQEKDETVKTFANMMIQKGRQQGLEEGISQGLSQGLSQGMEQVAQKMIKNGLSDQLIHEVTGLSFQKIDGIRRALLH